MAEIRSYKSRTKLHLLLSKSKLGLLSDSHWDMSTVQRVIDVTNTAYVICKYFAQRDIFGRGVLVVHLKKGKKKKKKKYFRIQSRAPYSFAGR